MTCRFFRISTLCVFLFLMLYCGEDAEKVFAQTGNSVSGFVFDASRQPVANIYVELQTDLYSTVSRIKTTSSGFYAFRGLRDGTYNIKILPLGTNLREQSKMISLVSFSPIPGRGSASEQVDFYLQPDKSNSAGLTAAPSVVFAQNVPDQAKKYYEEGIKLLDEKKDNEAFEKLKKSLEIFPDYYLALERLGTEYTLRGFYPEAYVLLTKSLKLNPKSFNSLFALGLTEYRLKQFDDAEKSMRAAIALDGNSINANLWLGILLHQNGKLTEAEKILLFANKLSKGESHEVHWQLARLYNVQKKYKEAADELTLFLKYNPKAKDKDKILETIQKLRQKN